MATRSPHSRNALANTLQPTHRSGPPVAIMGRCFLHSRDCTVSSSCRLPTRLQTGTTHPRGTRATSSTQSIKFWFFARLDVGSPRRPKKLGVKHFVCDGAHCGRRRHIAHMLYDLGMYMGRVMYVTRESPTPRELELGGHKVFGTEQRLDDVLLQRYVTIIDTYRLQ
ncbi:hypothetical protein B0H11DRAFT_965261 [Mycena galericulata]|nr:hypothetical protein B0H11DRAFT_965261 [Mycena galericulata]